MSSDVTVLEGLKSTWQNVHFSNPPIEGSKQKDYLFSIFEVAANWIQYFITGKQEILSNAVSYSKGAKAYQSSGSTIISLAKTVYNRVFHEEGSLLDLIDTRNLKKGFFNFAEFLKLSKFFATIAKAKPFADSLSPFVSICESISSLFGILRNVLMLTSNTRFQAWKESKKETLSNEDLHAKITLSVIRLFKHTIYLAVGILSTYLTLTGSMTLGFVTLIVSVCFLNKLIYDYLKLTIQNSSTSSI